MMDFFGDGSGINPGYWAEKLQNVSNYRTDEIMEYDPTMLKESVEEYVRQFANEEYDGDDEPDEVYSKIMDDVEEQILDEDMHECKLYDAFDDFKLYYGDKYSDFQFYMDEGVPFSYRKYKFHYIWLCWAIAKSRLVYFDHVGKE